MSYPVIPILSDQYWKTALDAQTSPSPLPDLSTPISQPRFRDFNYPVVENLLSHTNCLSVSPLTENKRFFFFFFLSQAVLCTNYVAGSVQQVSDVLTDQRSKVPRVPTKPETTKLGRT